MFILMCLYYNAPVMGNPIKRTKMVNYYVFFSMCCSTHHHYVLFIWCTVKEICVSKTWWCVWLIKCTSVFISIGALPSILAMLTIRCIALQIYENSALCRALYIIGALFWSIRTDRWNCFIWTYAVWCVNINVPVLPFYWSTYVLFNGVLCCQEHRL